MEGVIKTRISIEIQTSKSIFPIRVQKRKKKKKIKFREVLLIPYLMS